MSNLNLKPATTAKAPLVSVPAAKQPASASEIAEYIASQVEAPAINYQAIDCSNISLKEYHLEDSDINKAYSDAGITHIKLVNELGEIVPNARLVVSHRSGKDYSIVPFFPLILAVNQAKVELKSENQLKAFSEQGSLKARSSYKFVATPEQIDAMQAKAKMVWEQEVKELNLQFHTFCNGYEPTLVTLPIIWKAFILGAMVIPFDGTIYIRQVIKDIDSSTVEVLQDDNLVLDTTVQDTILRCTNYNFKLVA